MRHAREARGWSQGALALQLGKHAGVNVGGQSGVARIEQGVRPTRLNEVMAIANYLGIDMQEILTGITVELEYDESGQVDVDLLEMKYQVARTRLEKSTAELNKLNAAIEELEARRAQVIVEGEAAAQRTTALRTALQGARAIHAIRVGQESEMERRNGDR